MDLGLTGLSERELWYWLLGPSMVGASGWALSLLWRRSSGLWLNVFVTILVILTLLWSLSGLLIRIQVYDSPWFYLTARTTAGFTQWMLAAFGGVILLFVGHLKKNGDIVVVALGGALSICFGFLTVFSELIIESVDFRGDRLYATYGSLAVYMIIFDVLYAAAIFRFAQKAFDLSEDLIFKFQLQRILFSALIAILTIVVVNGLMTLLTKRVLWVPTGPVTLTIFYLSLAYTLGYGHSIAVEKKISSALRNGTQPAWTSVMAILGFITLLEAVNKEPKKTATINVPFGNNNYRITLGIVNGSLPALKQMGLLAESRKLPAELIERIRGLPKHAQLKLSNEAPLELGPLSEEIELIKAQVMGIYGDAYIFGDHNEFQRQHNQMLSYKKIRNPIIFVGEVGSGRAKSAQRMHYLRTGDTDLLPVDLATAAAANNLNSYLVEKLSSTPHSGVILRNLDYCAPAQLREVIHTLDTYSIEFVYITSTISIRTIANQGDALFAYAFSGPEVLVLPLRSQPLQVAAVAIDQIANRSIEWGREVNLIDRRVLNGLIQSQWPGNYHQLKAAIDDILIASDLNDLDSQYEAWRSYEPRMDITPLSPLKAAEKREIEISLLRNNWNKTKTKNDLELSANTLNAKIRQYGILLPRPAPHDTV